MHKPRRGFQSLGPGYAQPMSAAILFDRNQVEHLDDISDRPRRLSGSKLLWVDLDRRSEDGVSEVAEAFDLDDETRALLAESRTEPSSATLAATST